MVVNVDVHLQFIPGVGFMARNSQNQVVLMKAPISDVPPAGPSPMELLLMALAGCTGYDVFSILFKMRQKVESFEIHVSGVRRDEDPRVYTYVDLKYIVRGDVDEKKLLEAIKLSMEKYCSVSAMLRDGGVKINVSHEIHGASN
ncbi:MAG: OsmC family protein [archaeon YNP-LCB-024-027]|jgi:putative redox protein|nr:OsmC family protein [Candidatus Culexarchaeum yellowstonense]